MVLLLDTVGLLHTGNCVGSRGADALCGWDGVMTL